MDMVAHPDVGMLGQAMLIGRLDQNITKEPVVCFSGKDRLPVVATLNDVLWLLRNGIAGKASSHHVHLMKGICEA